MCTASWERYLTRAPPQGWMVTCWDTETALPQLSVDDAGTGSIGQARRGCEGCTGFLSLVSNACMSVEFSIHSSSTPWSRSCMVVLLQVQNT